MRETLTRWAKETFGEISPSDVFNLKEEVTIDKEGNPIRQIIMFLKKRQDFKAEWTSVEVISDWINELKILIGDNLMLQLFSTEGKELRYVGGLKGGEYKESIVDAYNYQFNLVLWKKVLNKG